MKLTESFTTNINSEAPVPLLTYSLRPSESALVASISEVGGKGLSLIDCSTAGFPVPPGFVLTVAFFESWLDTIQSTNAWKNFTRNASKDACDALKQECSSLQLDAQQRQELDAALEANFCSEPNLLVAVRSSSPEEDLVQASFAGGYETTLGVTRDKLLQAIQTSFASALDYRVVQYKLQNRLNVLQPRIAVVIQQQLNSQVSGVGFSLNPQNNAYDEAVVSANFGLGETVVAGVVTPDTFVVDKVKHSILSKSISGKQQAYLLNDGVGGGIREAANVDPTASSLTDRQILKVATLVANVEEHMGKPVDTEWAIEEHDKLYLLQARPITVYLPLFPEMITEPGKQKYLYMDIIAQTQGFSDQLSVLGLDVWAETLIAAKPYVSHGKNGMLYDIHGKEYFNLGNMIAGSWIGETLVKKTVALLDGSTRRSLELVDLKEYTPEITATQNKGWVWGRLKQLFHFLPLFLYSLWDPEHAMDSYVDDVDKIMKRFGQGGTEEATETTMTFGEEVDSTMAVIVELVPKISCMLMAYWSKWRLSKMFQGDEEVQDLLVALSMDLTGNPTSEMGHAMLNLASFPEVQETQTEQEFVKRLDDKAYSKEFLKAYDEFMFKFGCRGIKEIDIATPRTYEDPAYFFKRIKLIDVTSNQILTTKKRKEQAYEALLEHAARIGKEKQFKHHARVIQNVGGYREHGKYMYVFMTAYLRRRALALGKQWATEGRLKEPDDIFYLHIDEVTQAQTTPELDLKSLVAKNVAPYEAVSNVKDWPTVVDSRGKIFRAPREDVEGGLGGDPISPGTVRGKARVLKSPYEKPLESGEVLVTRATEPSWTPIFINASAVVLEVGGPLQHGAIIAREYGIPCVSGVDNAMNAVQDGDLLEVDGTNGIVKILREDDTDISKGCPQNE